jgi:hypothetical protein
MFDLIRGRIYYGNYAPSLINSVYTYIVKACGNGAYTKRGLTGEFAGV